MTPRSWLPAEVDVLVEQFKRRDMTGVYRTIERLVELDETATVTLTAEEARRVLDWALDSKTQSPSAWEDQDQAIVDLLTERTA